METGAPILQPYEKGLVDDMLEIQKRQAERANEHYKELIALAEAMIEQCLQRIHAVDELKPRRKFREPAPGDFGDR